MQHTSFRPVPCPVAPGLERVGEWQSIMILRDAFLGLIRFGQFQKSLGINCGLLARSRYCGHPPRNEYLLTQPGRDFRPVPWALLVWEKQHFAPDGLKTRDGCQDRTGGSGVAEIRSHS